MMCTTTKEVSVESKSSNTVHMIPKVLSKLLFPIHFKSELNTKPFMPIPSSNQCDKIGHGECGDNMKKSGCHFVSTLSVSSTERLELEKDLKTDIVIPVSGELTSSMNQKQIKIKTTLEAVENSLTKWWDEIDFKSKNAMRSLQRKLKRNKAKIVDLKISNRVLTDDLTAATIRVKKLENENVDLKLKLEEAIQTLREKGWRVR